jgi:hypothetical protein
MTEEKEVESNPQDDLIALHKRIVELGNALVTTQKKGEES